MNIRRLICVVAAHEDRVVAEGESGTTHGSLLRCARCGRQMRLPGSSVEVGRYTWDFGPH